MKKRGFTIVELIGVILVLALIMVLVIPSISDSSSSVKEKSYQTKIKSIETAAVLYGQDNYRSIISKGTSDKIYVRDLCPIYLKWDDEGEQLIEDPRDTSRHLNNCQITISIDTSNKKVTAELNESTC